MGRISVVSFDVFGTLLDLDEDKTRPEAYLQLARWLGYHGIRLDGEKLRRRLEMRTTEDLSASREAYPDVDISVLLESTIEELAPDSDRITKELVHEAALIMRTLTTRSLSAVSGARGVVKDLAGRLRLGICSNTQRAYTIGELRMFELLDPFEHIVFSSDVRAGKPNPKMFQTFLSKFQVPAEGVVHLGDRLDDDVSGALKAGMRPVLFARESPVFESASDASALDRTSIIHNFEELPEVIRSMSAQ